MKIIKNYYIILKDYVIKNIIRIIWKTKSKKTH